jgi:hypothetical protein
VLSMSRCGGWRGVEGSDRGKKARDRDGSSVRDLRMRCIGQCGLGVVGHDRSKNHHQTPPFVLASDSPRTPLPWATDKQQIRFASALGLDQHPIQNSVNFRQHNFFMVKVPKTSIPFQATAMYYILSIYYAISSYP